MSLHTARPILERLAFVFYLALCVGSCGVTGLGLIFAMALGDPRPLLFGCGGSVLAAVLRDVGYRQWHFQRWEESCRPVEHQSAEPGGTGEGDDEQKLEEVLHELTLMDNSSAEEERDVWKVQDLRRQANVLLERDPNLRARFASELAQHPELRG